MPDSEVKVQVDDYPTVHTDEPPPQQASRSPATHTNDDADDCLGVKQMKEDSDGFLDFAKNMFTCICCGICGICFGTICSIIMIVLCIAFPIASIVIGAQHLKDCPIERYIPIYLIVSGAFGIAKGCCSCSFKVKNRHQDEDEENKPNPVEQIVNLFLLAWLIAGSIWVYSIYGDVDYDNPESSKYCDKTTYLFTFSIITITYSFIGLALLSFCIISCVVCCCGIIA